MFYLVLKNKPNKSLQKKQCDYAQKTKLKADDKFGTIKQVSAKKEVKYTRSYKFKMAAV